jgi:glycogen operon protein
VLWTEWNGKYRDTVRRFWKGEGRQVAELATRLAGSSDLYGQSGRRPHASINFVTCHDGFTLHDLVSYNDKHNEANGEDNRDGSNHNDSWNCGAEGPTDDAEILRLRARQRRNFMATLMLSQGVPMINGGDEFGHSQRGNNNAYCQDNELTWYNWEFDKDQRQFLEFTRRLIAFRKRHPVLNRRTFFQGRRIRGSEIKDIAWFSSSGREMTDEEWTADHVRSMGMRLSGDAIEETDEDGRPIADETLLVLLNAHHETVPFVLPAHRAGTRWIMVLDTARDGERPRNHLERGGRAYDLQARSFAVFRLAAQGERRDETL